MSIGILIFLLVGLVGMVSFVEFGCCKSSDTKYTVMLRMGMSAFAYFAIIIFMSDFGMNFIKNNIEPILSISIF